MTKTTKILIVIAIVAILGGAIYYFNNKNKESSMDSPAGNDQFSIDDNESYKGARNLLPEADRVWVDPYVSAEYKLAKDVDKINGRLSKTLVLIRMTGQMSYNDKGKYQDGEGKPVLWPAEVYLGMWNNYRNPLTAKYGGLA